jgi:hypothetical protein
MKSCVFAACPYIRNVAVGGLVTFLLAACGGSDGSSSSGTSAAAGTSTSLVSPSVGFIDRSPAVASNSGSTGSTTAGSGTTAVASNGTASGSAPSQSASSGTATLDWTPPTQNSDGTTLTDLAGYTVYYGTSPGSLTQKVRITNPGLSAYTMTNLTPGTWYFAVTSTSSTGTESALSGVVSTRI